MQSWLDFTVHLPDRSEWMPGDQAREMVARQADGQLPPELFNYARPGAPKHGLSPFRFGSGKGCFHLYAVGGPACELLESTGYKITNLVGRKYGQPLRESRRRGRLQFESAAPLSYRISSLVLQPSAKGYAALEADGKAQADSPFMLEFAAEKIRQGLVRQGSLTGLDVEQVPWQVADVQIHANPRGERYVPIRIHGNGFALAARNVSFRLNAKLSGPWHVGHLISRGCGRVRLEGYASKRGAA